MMQSSILRKLRVTRDWPSRKETNGSLSGNIFSLAGSWIWSRELLHEDVQSYALATITRESQ